jgi:hypothetical protein
MISVTQVDGKWGHVRSLRDQHMREQSWARKPAVYGPRRRFGLHDALASRAAQLGAHMADDLKAGAHILQHLGNIFAEHAQLASAVRAAIVAGHMGVDFARQMLGQRPAERLRGNGHCSLHLSGLAFHGAVRFQLFELQLQLLHLPQHLLALDSEEHAPELLNQQLEVRDLGGARVERCCVLLLPGNVLLVLKEKHRLQRRMIESIQIHRHERVGHVRSMPRNKLLRSMKYPVTTKPESLSS